MLETIDAERLGIPTLSPSLLKNGGPSSCGPCLAHRPEPDLLGNLSVDPEINLPSPGMLVDISYFYNSNSPYAGPFGYGRTLSTNLTAQASVFPTSQTLVTLTRGNGAVVSYLQFA